MKKERIYTMKNTNDFIYNCDEETKLSFNLPSGITPDMICQIINYGNLCKDSLREYRAHGNCQRTGAEYASQRAGEAVFRLL